MHLPNPQLLTALRRLPDPGSAEGHEAAHRRALAACRTPWLAALARWLARAASVLPGRGGALPLAAPAPCR